jgi:hypothetical protein
MANTKARNSSVKSTQKHSTERSPDGKTTKTPAGKAAPAASRGQPSIPVGEAALARVRGKLLALPAERLDRPRYNLRLGAAAALGLVAEVERLEGRVPIVV